jgi:hypothetical protein
MDYEVSICAFELILHDGLSYLNPFLVPFELVEVVQLVAWMKNYTPLISDYIPHHKFVIDLLIAIWYTSESSVRE